MTAFRPLIWLCLKAVNWRSAPSYTATASIGEEDGLEAALIAARHGLNLPLVYNTGGYDSPEALALWDGAIDIYMPDMKCGDSAQEALAVALRFGLTRQSGA